MSEKGFAFFDPEGKMKVSTVASTVRVCKVGTLGGMGVPISAGMPASAIEVLWNIHCPIGGTIRPVKIEPVLQ